MSEERICKTCKYWTQQSNWNSDGVPEDGICEGIQRSVKVIINIDAGWDGGIVRNIETDEDFGCTLHESKEATHED